MRDFTVWSRTKTTLDARKDHPIFAHKRDIWWCSLGLNIGNEQDGKNDNFERPVLIIKRISSSLVVILPLTTVKPKEGSERYYEYIPDLENESWVILSQIRVISTKRLLRYIGKVNVSTFIKLIEASQKFLFL